MLNKEEILEYLKEIKPQLQKDGIAKIGLFGSCAKGTNDLASDIDIVIETTQDFRDKFVGFDGINYLEDLREDLQRRFRKSVDFCNIAGFKNSPQKAGRGADEKFIWR